MDTKARQRRATPWNVALPVMMIVMVLPQAAAQTEDDACDEPLRLTAYEHVATNATTNATATEDDLDAGAQGALTVRFTLEGCGTRTISLAAYEASATGGREDQTVFDADTQVFGEGDHSMTVAVPPCHYQIDLVDGEVLWRFELPLVTYEAQSRLLATLQGGSACPDPQDDGTHVGGSGGGAARTEGGGDATSQTGIHGDGGIDHEAGAIPCPTRIDAGANGDGSIVVEVAVAAEADATILYRATGSGDFVPLGKVDAAAGQYVDFDTQAGVAYTYRATTVVDGKESLDCPDVEITSIPVFPGVLGGALATVAGLVGYAVARRRR